MCWKKMPYWLKGGLISDSIFIIFGIIGLLDGIYIKSFLNLEVILSKVSSFFCIFYWLSGCVGEGCGNYLFICPIVDLIVLFMVGALIGFIISKFISSGKKKGI